MKFIIFLIVIWAVVVWFKKFKNNLLKQQNNQQETAASNIAARSLEGEKMVQCEHCGVHFPASEAIRDLDGHIYCTEEHRRLGAHS